MGTYETPSAEAGTFMVRGTAVAPLVLGAFLWRTRCRLHVCAVHGYSVGARPPAVAFCLPHRHFNVLMRNEGLRGLNLRHISGPHGGNPQGGPLLGSGRRFWEGRGGGGLGGGFCPGGGGGRRVGGTFGN